MTPIQLAVLFLLAASPSIGAAPAGGPVMTEVLVTSEAGQQLASLPPVEFRDRAAPGPVIEVFPGRVRQTIQGIGSSFTESAAFVLAHLDPPRRREVMERIFGASGANFTLTRTHIGSCDFSVEGRYSYVDDREDRDLASFSIAPDTAGFDPARYPGIRDPRYDLLPMIREAQAIKRAQGDDGPRIVASAWTAPPWMKDIEDWFIPGSAQNGWQGTGGSLKPKHEATYAEYLVRYLQAYESEGVPMWGLTPVNEPHGNGGYWESMHFSAESQADFIDEHLGPALRAGGFRDLELLVYDQNRGGMERWAEVIFSDPGALQYVAGIAIHWYESTFKVFEDTLDRVHEQFPHRSIVHTEGCIDNLGNEAPGGITDPAGFQESGWFGNDAFWWNETATDWAYTATWAGPGAADHPKYTPVHRYARNVIVSLDHWVSGWIDWNVVLDRRGGPNHVENFCGAPIMIDTDTGEIHYTPVFWVLAQFSRTIRPGDRAVETKRTLGGLAPDDLHACATLNDDGLLSVQLLNTTGQPIETDLRIGNFTASVRIPANAVQTVRIRL